MAKATIKSKSGAVIVIEGTDKEVSSIIGVVEKASTVGHLKEAVTKAQAVKKELKKRMAASDLVIGLKEDGFFNKPKNLGEILRGLEEKGHIYPMTTLSGVMINLVQKRLLCRKRVAGKWVYGK
jgi:hypothetical protein